VFSSSQVPSGCYPGAEPQWIPQYFATVGYYSLLGVNRETIKLEAGLREPGLWRRSFELP
jgi:hypothetical protein